MVASKRLYPAEGPDQRDIADNIDHLAIDRSRPVGKFMVERTAGGCEAHHREYNDHGDQEQHCGHRQAHRYDEYDCGEGGNARRQHVPHEHVLERIDGIGSGSDAAAERAGHPIGKVARGVPGQVPKQIAPQIARDRDESIARDEACEPPQQIVGPDQCRQ